MSLRVEVEILLRPDQNRFKNVCLVRPDVTSGPRGEKIFDKSAAAGTGHHLDASFLRDRRCAGAFDVDTRGFRIGDLSHRTRGF